MTHGDNGRRVTDDTKTIWSIGHRLLEIGEELTKAIRKAARETWYELRPLSRRVHALLDVTSLGTGTAQFATNFALHWASNAVELRVSGAVVIAILVPGSRRAVRVLRGERERATHRLARETSPEWFEEAIKREQDAQRALGAQLPSGFNLRKHGSARETFRSAVEELHASGHAGDFVLVRETHEAFEVSLAYRVPTPAFLPRTRWRRDEVRDGTEPFSKIVRREDLYFAHVPFPVGRRWWHVLLLSGAVVTDDMLLVGSRTVTAILAAAVQKSDGRRAGNGEN